MHRDICIYPVPPGLPRLVLTHGRERARRDVVVPKHDAGVIADVTTRPAYAASGGGHREEKGPSPSLTFQADDTRTASAFRALPARKTWASRRRAWQPLPASLRGKFLVSHVRETYGERTDPRSRRFWLLHSGSSRKTLSTSSFPFPLTRGGSRKGGFWSLQYRVKRPGPVSGPAASPACPPRPCWPEGRSVSGTAQTPREAGRAAGSRKPPGPRVPEPGGTRREAPGSTCVPRLGTRCLGGGSP